MKPKSVKAAAIGKKPSDTERFLDNFGTMLQVCFKIGSGNLERLAALIGPGNVERVLHEHRAACREFFGTDHEYYRELPKEQTKRWT